MRLRVGIVGLGSQWDSRYLPALRALADRFEVRGVCEQVAHLAQRAAGELGAVAVDGYRALAGRDDVDALLYLSDQWYGAAPILAACDFGKAVYSAISFPVDAEEAALLRSRVEESGIAFMAELPRRYAPATLRLKELIATRLGSPRMLFCHRRVPLSQATARPPRDRASEARDLMELVDWCRYVAGEEPTSVVAVRHAEAPGGDVDDYQMMSLDFSRTGRPGDGAIAQVSCGYYMPRQWEEAVGFRPPPALQVVCERGIAFVDLPVSLVWFDGVGRHQESLESERPVGEHMLLQFHRKVTSLVRAVSGLDDTLRAMQIVQAAATSQAEGRRVAV
ncbi:MAG: gfo/Idh/MocA family oxidoreductase [Planctomycetia bacterium]|nr:gfo/Idh/MocA family oxidoreductase [Planctomycetia bacterium]